MDPFSLLDSIQTIARNGLRYPTNEFDKERYERLLGLATKTYSELLCVPEEFIKERLRHEVGHITPKVGTDAAIFNESGEILLMERSDGSGWCLPCGFVEPNESPVEGVIREVREETGLEIKVNQLVGILPANQVLQWVYILLFLSFIYVKLLAVKLKHLMKVMH